jgi:hypothetical protein
MQAEKTGNARVDILILPTCISLSEDIGPTRKHIG